MPCGAVGWLSLCDMIPATSQGQQTYTTKTSSVVHLSILETPFQTWSCVSSSKGNCCTSYGCWEIIAPRWPPWSNLSTKCPQKQSWCCRPPFFSQHTMKPYSLTLVNSEHAVNTSRFRVGFHLGASPCLRSHIIPPSVSLISHYKPFWKYALCDISSWRIHLDVC